MRALLIVLSLAALCGCATATATRTTKNTDGSTTSDSITVKALLESLSNGAYANGTGMVLSITDATPDDQAISTLSAGVIQLGTQAMTLAGAKTNAPNTSVTNAPILK